MISSINLSSSWLPAASHSTTRTRKQGMVNIVWERQYNLTNHKSCLKAGYSLQYQVTATESLEKYTIISFYSKTDVLDYESTYCLKIRKVLLNTIIFILS